MATVAIYGAGQLGTTVAAILQQVPHHKVLGVFTRSQREQALTSKADVVIIATSTKFKDVASDIELAVQNGSHVLVSSEECAYPWAVDKKLADCLDALAKSKKVSISGTGVNPGLIFDSLVLTLLGAAPRGCTVAVRRTVNISGFGATVLRRLGMGFTPEVFAERVKREEILGHAGFPQSMTVVADAMGLTIDSIDKELLPVITDYEIDLPERFVITAGESAGVNQTYTAKVNGKPWFVSHFYGHVDLPGINKSAVDEIELSLDGKVFQTITVKPGIGSQVGSKNMVANSIRRILAAADGWVTVAHMEPAFPESH
jgi:4-hydroxy-tetrahydrodipicolinate reductase